MPAKDVKSAELQARLKRLVGRAGRHVLRPGPRRHRAHAALRGGLDRARRRDRRRRLAHVHVRRARRVRDGARLDRHRLVPRARLVLAGGARTRSRSSSPASTGRFVTGKDVILAVIGEIGVGGGTNAVLEFVGPGAEALSVDERLAVANMAVEAGSETGIFPADETVEALPRRSRARPRWTAERSDPDATLPAAPRDRPVGARAARRAAAPSGQREAGVGGGPVAGRPGLHRQLRERDDDRPAAGRVDPRRPARPSAHAGDRRPGDAGDLARGRGRGPARPVRRGGRDRLDADLRRVLRRLERASSPPGRTPSRRRTATSAAAWARPRPASTSRTRGSRPRPRSPASSSIRRTIA